MIYFVQAETSGAVKIGFSRTPDRRFSGLKASNSDRLKMLRTINGGPFGEKWLHDRYNHLHMTGEWFRFDEEMLSVELPPDVREELAPLQPKLPLSVEHPIITSEVASDFAQKFGAALRSRAGKDKEYGLRYLARELKISQGTLDQLLLGKHTPSGMVFSKLVAFFGAPFLQDVFGCETILVINPGSDPRAAIVQQIAKLQADLEAMS